MSTSARNIAEIWKRTRYYHPFYISSSAARYSAHTDPPCRTITIARRDDRLNAPNPFSRHTLHHPQEHIFVAVTDCRNEK